MKNIFLAIVVLCGSGTIAFADENPPSGNSLDDEGYQVAISCDREDGVSLQLLIPAKSGDGRLSSRRFTHHGVFLAEEYMTSGYREVDMSTLNTALETAGLAPWSGEGCH